MGIFWRKGFEGTSLSDLEQATGLGRQSLYGAFGDKQSLFKQAVEFYFAHVLKPSFVDVLDAPGSARANLERLFKAWEDYACSPAFQGCLVGNAVTDLRSTDSELTELLQRKWKLMEDALTRALRRAVADGEVSAALHPRETATTLLVLGQGLAAAARLSRERSYLRAILDSARKLLD